MFIEEVAIVVPLFSFFRHFWYVLFLVLHSPFSNLGLLLGSLGFSEGAPPAFTVMFLAFYTDIESSRVSSIAILAQARGRAVTQRAMRAEQGMRAPMA